MIKSIRVLGSGGAFDTDQVNSSFYIEAGNGALLYDCGYNVFAELKRLEAEPETKDIIKNISAVYLSHEDDDHVGSIKSLVYYRYFIHGLVTRILYRGSFAKALFDIDNFNREMKGSTFVRADIITLREIGDSYKVPGANLIITPVKGNHHIPSYGVILEDESSESLIAISGDTKANPLFEAKVNERVSYLSPSKYTSVMIFHDYSYWDAPSRQVHACKSDTQFEYSGEFAEKAIAYHNNKATCRGKVYSFPFQEEDINDITLADAIREN